ncbi:hypothetical protein H0O01_02525, partial [Candidatus Micrarchaeota archaeon]|nr:hypothetical protein [Candidatus Micrarchaeota archaeon]
MGDEEQAQQRKVRISPEAKEKIKIFAKKAGKVAGVLAVGIGAGAIIGAVIQYGVSQRDIRRILDQRGPQQCFTDYDVDSAGRSGIIGAMELLDVLIEKHKDNPQALADAIDGLQSVSGAYDFEPQKMGLLKKMVEDGGENAAYALRILGAMAKQGGYSDSLLDEQLAGRVVEAARLLAERCGEDAPKILDIMTSNGIFSQYYWQAPGPLGRLAFAESMLRNAKDAETMEYYMDVYFSLARRGENFDDYATYADLIFTTLKKVDDMAGPLAPGARNSVKALMGTNVERRSGESDQEYADKVAAYVVRAPHLQMIEAIGFIADRYPGGERMEGMLRLMANILRKGGAYPARLDAGYANELCSLTERQNPVSGIGGIHLVHILNSLLENPRFRPESINRVFVEKAGAMLDFGAAKAEEGRFGEFFTEISGLLHNFGQFRPAGQEINFEGLVDAAATFAEMDPDAETFMRHFRIFKVDIGFSEGSRESGRDYAMPVCEMEGMVAARTNNSRAARDAVERLENLYFGPGMARLVELMVGDSEGGRVISAINSISRTVERSDVPFGNTPKMRGIGPADYNEAYSLVQALFPGERMNLEILINFAYGISAVGTENARMLNKVFGMRYFFRYRQELLGEVVGNADLARPDGRPVFLAVFTQSDYNGTFYYSSDSLANLTRYYRVIIVETLSDAVMFREINRIAGQYGKLAGLSISGHGSEYGVALGPNGYFSESDAQEVARLQDSFADNPVVIFDSCSTGR